MPTWGDFMQEPSATWGFLPERAAAAEAAPPAQRTPDVEAFMESYRLWQAAEAAVAAGASGDAYLLAKCRGIAANLLSPGATFASPDGCSQRFAVDCMDLAVLGVLASGDPGLTRQEGFAAPMAALLRARCTLDVALAAVAGLPPPPQHPEALAVSTVVLERLRSPEVRRALEGELSALQARSSGPPLTYDGLLGVVATCAMHAGTYASLQPQLRPPSPESQAALRTALEVLPQLVAGDVPPIARCNLLLTAAMAAIKLNHHDFWTHVHAALRAAQRVGSDYHRAYCAFQLCSVACFVTEGGLDLLPEPPSGVLALWEEGEAAYKRCKRLLPHLWVRNFESGRAAAQLAGPWLRRLARQGDAWAPPDAGVIVALLAVSSRHRQLAEESTNRALLCDWCRKAASHLNRCSRCKRTEYCSTECQKAAWPQHKTSCRRPE